MTENVIKITRGELERLLKMGRGKPTARTKIGGRFVAECFGKDGKLKWRDFSQNIITSEGLDSILGVCLNNDTQIATWYVCMSETDTAPAAGLTYAVPSYTETEAYAEGNRPTYQDDAVSGQAVTNSSKAQFTINATKSMWGASLVGGGTDGNTKGDTAGGGSLLCYALFSSPRAVVSDDVINIQYTLSAADDGV